jgi:hypothetical protein
MRDNFPCDCATYDSSEEEDKCKCLTLEECNHEFCVCECHKYDSQEELKEDKDDFDYERVEL